MFPTVEVRWFYQGAVPAAVAGWFADLSGPVANHPARTDRYLRVEQDEWGIKLREGRLEIKRRHRTDGVVDFDDRVSGRVEFWRKWGFIPAGGDLTLSILTESGWRAVEKDRKLRAYRLAPNGAILPCPAGQMPSRGCEVELTQVEVAGARWWTVGLEAFGGQGDADRAEALLAISRYAFSRIEMSVFAARDSYSYPAWLARFGG